MGYADVFFLLSVFYLALSTLVFFVDRPVVGMGGAAADAH
jgi:hypothetical protein